MIRKLLVTLLCLIFLGASAQTASTNTQPDLKYKIGQMLMLGFKATALQPNDSITQDILAQRVGGVILFAKQFLTKDINNIENPAQLQQLTQSLQGYAKQAAIQNHNQLYPLLIGIDYEGGLVNQLKENMGFPKTVPVADVAKGSLANADQIASQMAQTLKRAGINLDFAPVLDVNVNPNNPIIAKYKRSFSDDPQQVARYARVYDQAFHRAGILCAYKHFPGHGSSTGDSHKELVDISKTWKSYELDPYRILFNQPDSCEFVMVGHLINRQLDPSGMPGTLSYAMMTQVLRQQLHFSGVIITDDLQMNAIHKQYTLEQTVRAAINGGADILLFGNQLVPTPQTAQQLIDIIYQDVQDGKISEARIDEAYQHIMQIKARLKA
ncbi:MAG: glycoside hydrolase family 3 N-terminal domain-containing protein [Gammaproteobacteria bacterium]